MFTRTWWGTDPSCKVEQIGKIMTPVQLKDHNEKEGTELGCEGELQPPIAPIVMNRLSGKYICGLKGK